MSIKHNSLSRQRGFNLVEVMVSVLIMSFGIVGVAGTQITAKRVGHEAVQRTTAANIALDIIERVRANPQALASYAHAGLGGGTITSEPTPKCSDNGAGGTARDGDRSAQEKLLKIGQRSKGGVTIKALQFSDAGAILFDEMGMTNETGILLICDESGRETGKAAVLNVYGEASVANPDTTEASCL